VHGGAKRTRRNRGAGDFIVAGRTIVKDGVVAGVDLEGVESELKGYYKRNLSRDRGLQQSWDKIEIEIARWFTGFLHCG
jgi:hypothetical protein